MAAPVPAFADPRLYGRQKDKKLRRHHAALMADLLPRVAVTAETAAARRAAHAGDAWLEVGFGGGEHLAAQAAAHPNVLMLGAEPFVNGVAKLLAHIEAGSLSNVAVLHGDVRPLLVALPAGSLQRMFVLHPDPWPKTRHRKRRMISPAFLHHAARLLSPGGELRVASDIPDYVLWTLMQVQIHNRTHGDFRFAARSAVDWLVRPDDWPQTRYEVKALREGRRPAYLSFHRQ